MLGYVAWAHETESRPDQTITVIQQMELACHAPRPGRWNRLETSASTLMWFKPHGKLWFCSRDISAVQGAGKSGGQDTSALLFPASSSLPYRISIHMRRPNPTCTHYLLIQYVILAACAERQLRIEIHLPIARAVPAAITRVLKRYSRRFNHARTISLSDSHTSYRLTHVALPSERNSIE